MEVIIWEVFVRVLRFPGALLLAAVTKRSFDHWMDHGSVYGVAIVGAGVISLFIYIAVLSSG